ncbi:MAG: hypothetical protein C0619_03790 [Desulfuromonas sp.]|nr:MAG: hypothetical protein C0619_03790 [Desulfuromonas sp.]
MTRPLHWGGYRVIPESLEFWPEGENHLHETFIRRSLGWRDIAVSTLLPKATYVASFPFSCGKINRLLSYI